MNTILVDMDGVLNNFNPHFLGYVKRKGYKVVIDDDRVWNLGDYFEAGSKEKADRVVNEIFCTPGFWITLPVRENAPEVLKELSKKYYLRIATAPWPQSATCEMEKLEWMNVKFPFIHQSQIVFSHTKWKLPAQVMIDDNPKYLDPFTGIKICWAYKYNEGTVCNHRVNSWLKIGEILNDSSASREKEKR
jgi:5'(3')-deoxyribonucleotidase